MCSAGNFEPNLRHRFKRSGECEQVKRKLNSTDVINALTSLFVLCAAPTFNQSELRFEDPIGSSPMGDARQFVAQEVLDRVASPIGKRQRNLIAGQLSAQGPLISSQADPGKTPLLKP